MTEEIFEEIIYERIIVRRVYRRSNAGSAPNGHNSSANFQRPNPHAQVDLNRQHEAQIEPENFQNEVQGEFKIKNLLISFED